jgi:uncharacterized protein YbjT (DUF2867 family)
MPHVAATLSGSLPKQQARSSGRSRLRCHAAASTAPPSGGTVLVAGATGGVGQLAVAYLLSQGYTVRALVRDKVKAETLFAAASAPRLELVVADTRTRRLLQDVCHGLQGVICCTGTTAFPSSRWAGDNGPEQTDAVGVANLVDCVADKSPGLQRFVLVSSVGVLRTGQLPFSILNLGGVLTSKAKGEAVLQRSGLPWTILRPGRLTDGPYTSYDLNTLLKATAETRRKPQLALDDTLTPQESSRLVVASAAVAALRSAAAVGKCFDVGSVEGEGIGGGGSDAWQAAWDSQFAGARRAA